MSALQYKAYVILLTGGLFFACGGMIEEMPKDVKKSFEDLIHKPDDGSPHDVQIASTKLIDFLNANSKWYKKFLEGVLQRYAFWVNKENNDRIEWLKKPMVHLLHIKKELETEPALVSRHTALWYQWLYIYQKIYRILIEQNVHEINAHKEFVFLECFVAGDLVPAQIIRYCSHDFYGQRPENKEKKKNFSIFLIPMHSVIDKV